MPTYVYKFIDTGETIEVQQAFTDDALTHAHHPLSGKKLKVKKVFTPVGVSFRGGGFYKTDSRGGKSKTSSNGTTTTESSSSSSSDTKSSGDSSKTSTSSTTPAATTSTTRPATPAKTSSKTSSNSD